MARDLNTSSEVVTQLLVSLFVLGWSSGPLIVAPLSEAFGRAKLLNYGHASFLIANTLCAITTNKWLFLVLRFVSGFVGSAPLSVRQILRCFDVAYKKSYMLTKSGLVGEWCSCRSLGPGRKGSLPRGIHIGTSFRPCSRPNTRWFHCSLYLMALDLCNNIRLCGSVLADRTMHIA